LLVNQSVIDLVLRLELGLKLGFELALAEKDISLLHVLWSLE